MVDAHFSFQTSSFTDSEDDLAENVNGIAGKALAQWLAARLGAAGLDASEVWAEDHGWDFSVMRGETKYLCACSIEADEETREAHVSLAKHRSLMDRMRGRNAYAADDPVVDAIRSALAGNPDVANLASEV